MPTEHDDLLLDWFKQSRLLMTGNSGWIRAVRTRRNMQSRQLAQKMQVSPSRVSVLERDELRGAVTLKMMQKAATALDCVFVYALLPKAAATGDKPRVRLDSAYMRAAENASAAPGSPQSNQRSRRKTTPD